MERKFYIQNAPDDMYCNATAVLKIDSVYKQNYITRYMLKGVNTLM